MSIFGTRELSLKHWRYRTLHWCFNVKGLDTPEESPLPNYLYSHYCPLFHLTNFIALVSPLILAIKMTVGGCKGVAWLLCKINWDFLKVDLLRFFRRNAHPEPEPLPPTEQELRNVQWAEFKKFATGGPDGSSFGSGFEAFWEIYGEQFDLIQKQDAEIRYKKILADVEQERDRRARMAARIEWLIHFSRRVLKGSFYVASCAALVLLGWVVYHVHAPVIAWFGDVFGAIGEMFTWLFSLEFPDIRPFLIIAAQIVGATLLLTGIIMLVLRFRMAQTCGSVCQKAASICILTPLLLLTRVIGFPFMMLFKFIVGIKNFIGEFYENHCPPITIVGIEEEVT
jgi:hypothetical protein